MVIDMADENRTVWPFPVLSEDERTEQQEKAIEFLEAAHEEGFRAFTFLAGSFRAETENGRRGEIIHRGGNRIWELILSTHDDEVASRKVGGFTQAAEAVLDWLRGKQILEVRVGGSEGAAVSEAFPPLYPPPRHQAGQ